MSDDFLSPDFGDIAPVVRGPRQVIPYEILKPGQQLQKEQADFRPHVQHLRDDEEFAPKDSSVPEFAPSSAPPQSPTQPETDETSSQEQLDSSADAEKVSTVASDSPDDLPF